MYFAIAMKDELNEKHYRRPGCFNPLTASPSYKSESQEPEMTGEWAGSVAVRGPHL